MGLPPAKGDLRPIVAIEPGWDRKRERAALEIGLEQEFYFRDGIFHATVDELELAREPPNDDVILASFEFGNVNQWAGPAPAGQNRPFADVQQPIVTLVRRRELSGRAWQDRSKH